jgi:hypothetical protein
MAWHGGNGDELGGNSEESVNSSIFFQFQLHFVNLFYNTFLQYL